jgi:hypothetical protein
MGKPPGGPSPAARRAAQRAFLGLLALGLAIGGLTAIGVVAVMDRLSLFDGPAQRQYPPSP